jgi:hypothetical protein
MDESLSEEGLIRSDDEVLKETESEAKEIDGKDREYGLGFGVKQFGMFHNETIIGYLAGSSCFSFLKQAMMDGRQRAEAKKDKRHTVRYPPPKWNSTPSLQPPEVK